MALFNHPQAESYWDCVEKKTVSETGNHHILHCLTLQAIKMDEEERKTMEYDAQVSLFVHY